MTYEELQNQLTQAEVEELRGNYDEAERLSHEILAVLSSSSLEELSSAERTELQADSTRILGIACLQRGDYDHALEHLHAALNASEQLNELRRIARFLGNIGLVHMHQGSYPKSLEYYNKALSIDNELDNKLGMAKWLGNIGTVYRKLSDYSKALEYLGKALDLADELDNKFEVARWLGNIGSVYGELSDYTKALECFKKALKLEEELGNTLGAATWLGNIGNVYHELSDYPKALEYHNKALSLDEEIGNKSGIARHLGGMGLVYNQLGDQPKTLEYYARALSLDEELSDKSGISIWLNNIGTVHVNLSDYSKAHEYFSKSLSLAEELGFTSLVATNLGNIGLVHFNQSAYPKALEYFSRALSLDEESGNKSGAARHLGNIGAVHIKLGDYPQAQEYIHRGLMLRIELGMRSEVGECYSLLGELYADSTNPQRDEAKSETYLLDSIAISDELGTKRYSAHKTLATLYEKQNRWQESHYHQGKYFTLKDELQSEEARKKAQLMEQHRHIVEREKEIAIAKAAADAQMSATTTLLYKVLPQSVATRMIEGEEEIADYFPQVSILFADIAGFTPISADMPAIIVVRFLNYVFGEFDRIIKKHGCEKIKTIGDGYMAVCGAPTTCEDHAERLAAAALEMQERIVLPDSIREYMPEGIKLGVRIGLHTGSIVAGVIGEERFVYDIYSDAVNTAARMESHGEENRIHISNDFFRHMQNRFAMTKNTTHGFVFEKRGEMEIKGKGMMRTYFLERAT